MQPRLLPGRCGPGLDAITCIVAPCHPHCLGPRQCMCTHARPRHSFARRPALLALAVGTGREKYLGGWVAEVAMIRPNGYAVRGFASLQRMQVQILRIKQAFLKKQHEAAARQKKEGGPVCLRWARDVACGPRAWVRPAHRGSAPMNR